MMLKSVRNLVADSAANAVYQVPTLEQALIHCGRVINTIPLVRTIYRRSAETLTRRLGAVGGLHRRLQIDDLEFIFDISDFTVSPWFFNRRLFEPLTTRFVLACLRPGMTCIDIGANRGYFSILAALRVTASGHVYSFEPNPTVMADLRTHVALNGVEETVECSELAIADRAGKELELFVSTWPTNSGLSSITPSEDLLAQGILTPAHTIRVRTETLDEWVKAARLYKQIDLIKIDVEGAEDLVLRGMNRLLQDAPPHRIIIETTLNSSAHCRLSRFGYRSKLLDQGGDKFNILFTHPTVTQA